jgi:MtN3 and saliva related transmembrane protein
MDGWTYLAFVAGALTSTGYLPQIIKGYRTRKLDDVSLVMPVVLGFGMFLWLIYGLAREDSAIIAANVIGASLTTVLVLMKMRYSNAGTKASG